MNPEILLRISKIVAKAMNDQNLGAIGPDLNTAIPADMSQAERAACLDEAIVYSLVCEQPGYPDDGLPGYLPADADLKDAVLNEIQAMIRADFDKAEHRAVWEELEKSVQATPEADFVPGVAVNCPDDYLLTLDRLTCGDVLRKMNALPAWGQTAPDGAERPAG